MRIALTTRAMLAPALLAVCFTFMAMRPCHAADGDKRQRAMELFEQSEQRYRAGELEEAQSLLIEAYALDPNPVLQYNLGRVYEALGKLEEAAVAFRAFLEGTPDAADRGAIERRIRTLEKQLAERNAMEERNRRQASKPPPPAPSPPPPVQDSGPGAAPWIVAGVGAAVLVGGVVAGVLAQRAHDDAVDDPSFQGAKDAQDRAENLALAANLGFAVGGTAVAVGVGWGLFGQSEPAAPGTNAKTRWQSMPTTLTFGGSF